tara:strand:+ start:395 stop:619 length:225 start_codon:yes stop_codon:yes gene_type:complete
MLAICNETQQNPVLMFVTQRDIEALVDNELSSEDRTRVMKGMERSPALKSQYDALVAQKEALKSWWSEMGCIQN